MGTTRQDRTQVHRTNITTSTARLLIILSLVLVRVGYAYGQSFELRNSTSVAITITLTAVKSAGEDVSYDTTWELGPGKSMDVEPTVNKKPIQVDSVSLTIRDRFGENALMAQFDSSATRQIEIRTGDLPLVQKQSNFRTWTTKDGKSTCKAKLAHHFIEKGQDKVQLLKTDGKVATVSLDKLCTEDLRFVESIESGENPIVWKVGSKYILPKHLIGKQVTIIMRARHYSEVYRRVEPKVVYGPIITGSVTDATLKVMKPNASNGKSGKKESLPGIQIDGEMIFFAAGLLGTKEKRVPIEGEWLTFQNKGVRTENYDFTNSAIDSILVDGQIYVESKGAKLALGTSEFWSKLKEEQPIRFFSEGDEVLAKAARGLVGLATVMGGLAIGAAHLSDGDIEAPPSKEDFLIEGRTLPGTVIYYGSGIGTYNKVVSDARGNYRIYSLIRPNAGNDYYLDLEIGGKRVRKWNGKLNPNGKNNIDLL